MIKNKITKHKMNYIIILFLMIITGFIIYYMYLKPESFDCITNPSDPSCIATNTTNSSTNNYCLDTVSNPSDPQCISNYCSNNPTDPDCIAAFKNLILQNTTKTTIPQSLPNNAILNSIISRHFGIGFNVYSVISSLTANNTLYLIEHIPITYDGVSGGCYSISSDGLFTIKIRNNDDSTQWWSINDLKDNVTNTIYEIVQPFTNTNVALQYANGSLSITPYMQPGFESQKWIKSKNTVARGIPVLNVNPASMFTTEFDPYSTSTSVSTSLSDANNVQVNNVINSVQTGIQSYLNKINPNTQLSSTLGNKNMPLSVNLNLNGATSLDGLSPTPTTNGISYFDNVTGSTSSDDILSILDKYTSNTNNSQTTYNNNSLENQLNQSNHGCKLFNINDYTSNRVSTCNCKL